MGLLPPIVDIQSLAGKPAARAARRSAGRPFLDDKEMRNMSSFLKIASASLLSLSLVAGCLTATESDDGLAEATAAADTSTTTTSPPCGPGTLLQSLGYALPGYYGPGFYPGYYPAGTYGGGLWPGYGSYGYGMYGPGYYGSLVQQASGCGCGDTDPVM
jgi:hypothetical protein